jgi:hypothetical protein
MSGLSVDEIANKIGKPSSAVQEYLESKREEVVVAEKAEIVPPKSEKSVEKQKKHRRRVNMREMMQTSSRSEDDNKPKRTIHQMTKGASERQDELRKRGIIKSRPAAVAGIFRPLDHMNRRDEE